MASIILPKSVTILYFLAICPSKKSVNAATTNSIPDIMYFKSISILPLIKYVGNSIPIWSKGNNKRIIIISDIITLDIVILFALFIFSISLYYKLCLYH